MTESPSQALDKPQKTGAASPRSPGLLAMHLPHSLPAQPRRLIGRGDEIASIRQMILREDVRLLTLVGAPGVGKTRLALAVAGDLLDAFDDGVFFVDLAPITDPLLVVHTTAEVLGVKETECETVLPALRRHLQHRRLLLLLDNFEQVLAASAQIAEILTHCLRIKILVTSREALHLRWEQVFPVSPLPVPAESDLLEMERVGDCPSVRLFVDRARAIRPEFDLDKRNVAHVAEVCAQLDGIPLAIELAAGQIDILGPKDIVQELHSQGLGLFEAGPEDLPQRQQTLRQAIGWSYDLLNPEEQQVLRRLAIFVGGCTIEAARAICGRAGIAPADVSTRMSSLVRKSLLRLEETDGERRFWFLEMVRQYGVELLIANGELKTTGDRHAAYFFELVERAEPHIARDWQDHWFYRLAREQDNLRAALRWLKERGHVERGLQLAGGLWHFWRLRARYSEGRRQIEALLELADGLAPGAIQAKALVGAGELARYNADYAVSRACHERALAIFRELDDRQGLAMALLHLAAPMRYLGDFKAARAMLEESLTLCRELSDPMGISLALVGLSEMSLIDGDCSSARLLGEEALSTLRSQGDRWGTAAVLNIIGAACFLLQDYEAARSSYAESLKLAREVGDGFRMAFVFEGLACLAAAEGQKTRALCLEGIARELRVTVAAPLPPPFSVLIEQLLRRAREGLSAREISVALRVGRKMGLERAIEYALDDRTERYALPIHQSGYAADLASSLTRRERQVVELIARGLANRHIASELVISERTVETHVSNILAKLGLTSRTQIAARAIARKLE